MTKALTKTTNCTFRAKKSGGARPKKLRRFAPDCMPPTFKFRRHCMALIRLIPKLQSYDFMKITIGRVKLKFVNWRLLA